ncbi:MAG: lamin tail domain-containing protein, partial [Phycisphaerae bacterium]
MRRRKYAVPSGITPSFEALEPRVLLSGQPIISELLAINDSGLQDGDGDRSDWLEVHNPGTVAVDLTGWKLEDGNNEWVFPESWQISPPGDPTYYQELLTLGPGEYLVVMASGKGDPAEGYVNADGYYLDVAGYLHTNFSLKGGGEYLGLLDDTNTVVHEYDEYPAQTADISYGIAQDIDKTEFVSAGDSAKYLVPGGGEGDWTSVGFDDGSWQTGETALGFADTVPGFAVWNYKASVTVGHLDTALDVIDSPGMQSYVNSENIDVVNYWNSGGHGHYDIGEPNFPGFTSEMNDFVIEAKAFVTIPAAGEWSFGVNSDDGFQLTIAGATTTAVANSTAPAGGDTISYATPRGNADTLGVFDFPGAGTYQLRLVMYERGGGSSVELFAAPGAHTSFNGTIFDLVGDTANGGVAVFSEPVTGGSAGSELASLIETDVEAEMKGVNASMFVRLPFNVADPGQVELLTLRMKYDDGYVAYLNGQEIARRNAPAVPLWDSNATAERTDAQATTWENADVTAYLGELDAGANVLAVHALNYATDDGDFLVLPELCQVLYLGLGEHFFATATPGDVNSEEYWLYVEDTQFSQDRGFYEEAFDLEITADTPGATIIYTTDGSEPTAANGTQVPAADELTPPTATVHIATSTTVRAVATKAYCAPSNVDTQTYIFIEDVIAQPQDPEGFPTLWRAEPADYEMNPAITGDALYADSLTDALLSLPAMSIVMDIDDLFDYSTGIYSNPTADGWERPGSLEYFDPVTGEEFQVNAGVRIYGGVGRQPQYKKHSFRILFKSDYGPTKLNYPLFGDDAVDEFDTIILRSNFNDAWVWGGADTQFIRDEFLGQIQKAMGDPGRDGDFVHLYINGLYWGLYNPCERPDQSFAASYFGGDKEDWDVINSTQPTGESQTGAWNELMNQSGGLGTNENYQKVQGNNLDGTDNPAYEDYLDIDNYVNYLLANFWGGNNDWVSHNWYTGRMRGPDSTGFKGFSWDAEWIMDMRSGLYDNSVSDTTTGNYLLKPYTYLRDNAEFRMVFADHVHKHFFNGGVLTPEYTVALYQSMADLIELSVITEAARWGDVNGYYDPEDWANERDYLLNTYLPQRTGIVLNQLSSAGLYPGVVAPSFNINGSYQHAGTIDPGDSLTIDAPAGTIYYTTDGTDPRELYGGIAPGALTYSGAVPLNEGTHVKSRVYDNGEWSALNEATFCIDLSGDIRITEIMYHPSEPTAAEQAAGFNDGELFEFIEIKNVSATETLPLEHLRFTNGIDFTFPAISVAPGGYVIVVKDQAAFNYRYATFTGTIAGEYDGWLSNSGERIELNAPIGGTIHDFRYGDGWYGHTDGEGFSLTIRDPGGALELWDQSEGWRASAAPGGTPGTDDALVEPGSIVISEVLAHSDTPFVDVIELHNTTGSPIDVSGWFLSDQKADDLGGSTLEKYQIPALPAIDAGGYLVLYEGAHFGGAFSLSELGDDVYLSSNAGGVAGGYREHVDFGASPRNVSIGLHTKSTGGTDFTLLSAHSFGSANAQPYIEDLVINEVMYHPPDPTAGEIAAGFLNDDDFEFIEIYNTSTTEAYALSDFYVGNGVGFTFGWYDTDSFATAVWTLESGATATWAANLPITDTYEVFVYVSNDDLNGGTLDLDSAAVYRIVHSGGPSTRVLDQNLLAGNWASLGTFPFDAGEATVTLTRGPAGPDERTVADRIKFVRTGQEVVADNSDLSFQTTGTGFTTLPAGGYVVIASSYAAFDERYDMVGNNIPVAGQYTGNLSNNGEKVKLMRVGEAEPGGFIPYYRVDYVNYDDDLPWPQEPDGSGNALNRLRGAPDELYGNDPASWEASTYLGTPGSLNAPIDRTPPTAPTGVLADVALVPGTRIELTWTAAVEPDSYVDHYV